jgi:hypothetical protein
MISWTSQRAKVAGLKRARPHDDPEVMEAVQELRVTMLEQCVRRVVNANPPLSGEQLARLAALLRPVQDGGAQR